MGGQGYQLNIFPDETPEHFVQVDRQVIQVNDLGLDNLVKCIRLIKVFVELVAAIGSRLLKNLQNNSSARRIR